MDNAYEMQLMFNKPHGMPSMSLCSKTDLALLQILLSECILLCFKLKLSISKIYLFMISRCNHLQRTDQVQALINRQKVLVAGYYERTV